jgi:DNA helicase II / ATP-dependent DNA helicase PcrA
MIGNFKREYSRLNKNQKLAVDSIDGPIMVMAGPGTGKTQVLTLRIANILKKTDTSPSSILALTFTEAASHEMRERLIKLIGQPAYSIKINTFHSFCQSVILDNPSLFITTEENSHLQDLDRTKILQEIINQNKFLYLKPLNAPFYYTKTIIEKIKTLKREGISPKEFKVILKDQEKELDVSKADLSRAILAQQEKDLRKNLDLQKIYLRYQHALKEQGKFDFEDMINWVVDKFTDDKDLLLSYQENLNFILVDEYQDTNSAQNQLIFQLSSYWQDQANLFVVGDPNQSIYRFQGASFENTKEFISRFPKSTLVNLDINYRSTEVILSSAHAVIKSSPTKESNYKQVKLTNPKSVAGQKIKTAHFSHSLFEDQFLLQDIKSLLKKKTRPQDIAIIARYNKDLQDISLLLKKENIPFTLFGTHDLFEQPLIKQIITLLHVIHNLPHQHQDRELFTLLNFSFLEIDPLSILKTTKKASDHRIHLASFILSNRREVPQDIKDFFKKIITWHQDQANLSLPEFFEKLLKQSGLLNHLLKGKTSLDKLEQVSALFTQIKNQAHQDPDLTISRFLDNVEALKQQQIKTPISSPISSSNSVTITTAHKAKGLEWSHVYLYRCVNGKWGNPRPRNLIKLPQNLLEFATDQNPHEEERRLFYVALTRAKKTLVITSASQYLTEYGTQNTLPSPFISQIPSKFTKIITPKIVEDRPLDTLISNLTYPKTKPLTVGEKEYLKPLVKDFKLSVTALETFLNCPYKFKLNNLYRLPRSKEAYLAFGTAIHKSLERYQAEFQKTNHKPKLSFLTGQFKKALSQEILSPHDYSERLDHGLKILKAYHSFYHQDTHSDFILEKYLGSSSSKCQLGDISLVGKIDKIEILDPSKKIVKIIDYKTGKPKTKGEVEGTTKNSTGHLKRQLVFYALLCRLDKSFPYRPTHFELDFVESPYLKNKSGRTVFSVSDEEIVDLRLLIKQSMDEINSLEFSRTSDTSLCQRCEFRDHCHPQAIPKTISQTNQDSR